MAVGDVDALIVEHGTGAIHVAAGETKVEAHLRVAAIHRVDVHIRRIVPNDAGFGGEVDAGDARAVAAAVGGEGDRVSGDALAGERELGIGPGVAAFEGNGGAGTEREAVEIGEGFPRCGRAAAVVDVVTAAEADIIRRCDRRAARDLRRAGAIAHGGMQADVIDFGVLPGGGGEHGIKCVRGNIHRRSSTGTPSASIQWSGGKIQLNGLEVPVSGCSDLESTIHVKGCIADIAPLKEIGLIGGDLAKTGFQLIKIGRTDVAKRAGHRNGVGTDCLHL